MSGYKSSPAPAQRKLLQWTAVVLAILAVDQLTVWAYGSYANEVYGVMPSSAADAAVVLFSAFDADGSLDAETHRRLEHGISLLRRSMVREILCSGGAGADGRRQGAKAMAAYLRERGIFPGNIHAEWTSFDTSTNVEQSLAFARRQGWTSLVFVSSPVHLPRVRFFAPNAPTRLQFSAYTASGVASQGGWSELNLQAHHEWVAWSGYVLLPRAHYRAWVARWRGVAPLAVQ